MPGPDCGCCNRGARRTGGAGKVLSFLRTALLGVHAIEFLVRSRCPATVTGRRAAAEEATVAIHFETTAQILRLYHAEKWRCGTIARHLNVHHSTVERLLAQAGLPRIASQRAALIDDYLPFILQTLEKYPQLTASRLYGMVCERGYVGGPDYFRRQVARHRPRKAAEAYLRLRTLPGEQCQCDWASFSHLMVGRARRPLISI